VRVAPFTFDKSWAFPATPEQVWDVLTRTEDYRRWWPWLAVLESDGLREGATARCVVRPPLPYRLHFDVHVDRVEPARTLDARVTGDLQGPAQLELASDPAGCTVRLSWEVQLASRRLQRVARIGRPVMQWGHDLVVDMGVRQFRRRALGPQG